MLPLEWALVQSDGRVVQKQPVLLRGRPQQADSGDFQMKSFENALELVA